MVATSSVTERAGNSRHLLAIGFDGTSYTCTAFDEPSRHPMRAALSLTARSAVAYTYRNGYVYSNAQQRLRQRQRQRLHQRQRQRLHRQQRQRLHRQQRLRLHRQQRQRLRPTPTPTPTPPGRISQITPTGTTCNQFRNGTAETLDST